MSMEDDYRNDEAVYWAATELKTKHAKSKVAEGVELLVRWENRVETIFGRDFAPVKILAVLVVDRDIPEGSIFWRGALADLPVSPTDLLIVEKFSDVPDIKGVEHRKVAYLGRYTDSLPQIQSGTGT